MSKSKIYKLFDSYVQHRFQMLFYSLLLTFCAAPILVTLHLPGYIYHIFLGLNLSLALIGERKFRSLQVIILTILIFLFGAGLSSILKIDYFTLILPLLAIFSVGAVAFTVKSSIHTNKVNDETLYAALSGYILAGLCMAFVYWSMEQLIPGSFIISDSLSNQSFSIASAIYFSFITLATLGYVDIIPSSDFARGLVVLETVAGQLYLVVMVARLVGLYRAREEFDVQV